MPNYPEEPNSEEEKQLKPLADKVKGSAVNPVLKKEILIEEPKAVKNYAKKNLFMGDWSASSKTHVSSMPDGDFLELKNLTCNKNETVKIVFNSQDGDIVR